VARFGVRPDDGADDADALQAAIDAAGPRKILAFAPGVYEFSRPVDLASDQTYRGQKGVVMKVQGQRPHFIMASNAQARIRISCIAFKGGGIVFRGVNKAIGVSHNSFEGIYDPKADYGGESGIFITDVFEAGHIANNRFRKIGYIDGKPGSAHGNGILAYHLNNTEIVANTFEDIHQAISLIFEGWAGSGRGIRVAGNVVRNPLRMGIEAHGVGTHHAMFEDNLVTLTRTGDQDIGLSIVINHGYQTIVRNNRVINQTPLSQPCSMMGIEAAGIDTRVSGNEVAGHWCSAIAVYSDEMQYTLVEGNTVCGHRSRHPPIDFYKGKAGSVARNNTIEKGCSPAQLSPDKGRAVNNINPRTRPINASRLD